MNSLELFVGAGGLGMGVSKAGFHHRKVIERDSHSCRTLRFNQERGMTPIKDWSVHEGDVRSFDYSALEDRIDFISGGPPCQPFSLGGKHRGFQDERDMFPEAVRAVREIRPKAFLFENVRGLLRRSFAKYFEYIILRLTYPDMERRSKETWEAHLGRLERRHTRGKQDGLHYRVVFRLLNAADYGVPQKRERVIIVGFRNDIDAEWSFPEATHSRDALLWSKWETGEYWERHRVAKRQRPEPPVAAMKRVQGSLFAPTEKPWTTVRDALADLPDPAKKRNNGVPNHVFQPGARAYPGHTGSPLDEPSKTLKAGDHGVPGGENMIAYPDGRYRYLTVRESARIQTFPDDYQFCGSWTESMQQIGNAVPVDLGHVVANRIHRHLKRLSHDKK